MIEDRRADKRVSINLPARWYGLSGIHEVCVQDISLGGCFVDTPGRTEVNETVRMEIQLPSGEWLPLRGEVASAQPGIGFGLRFSSLTDEEELALRQLVS